MQQQPTCRRSPFLLGALLRLAAARAAAPLAWTAGQAGRDDIRRVRQPPRFEAVHVLIVWAWLFSSMAQTEGLPVIRVGVFT